MRPANVLTRHLLCTVARFPVLAHRSRRHASFAQTAYIALNDAEKDTGVESRNIREQRGVQSRDVTRVNSQSSAGTGGLTPSSTRVRVRNGIRSPPDPSWEKTVECWHNHAQHSLKPTLLNELKTRQERGSLDVNVLLHALWILLADLIQHCYSQTLKAQVYRGWRSQFLETWALLLRTYRDEESESTRLLWEHSFQSARQLHGNSRIPLDDRLKTLFPTLPEENRGQLGSLAAASFSYLIMDKKNFAIQQPAICFFGQLLHAHNAELVYPAKKMLRRSLFGAGPHRRMQSGRFLRTLSDLDAHAEIVVAMSAMATSTTHVHLADEHLVQHFRRQLLCDMKLGITGHAAKLVQRWGSIVQVFHNHWQGHQESPYLTSQLARTLARLLYRDGDIEAATILQNVVVAKGNLSPLEDLTLKMTEAGRLRRREEMEAAWAALTAARQPDALARGSLITAHLNCRLPERAMEIFSEWCNSLARAQPLPSAAPDTGTINAILTSLSYNGYSQHMRTVMHYAQRLAIRLNAKSYNTLMNAARNHQEAAVVFEEMVGAKIRPNMTSFNILLDSLYRQDKNPQEMDEARQILEEMKTLGIPLGRDTVTIYLKLVLWKHHNLPAAMEIVNASLSQFNDLDHVMLTTLFSHIFQNPSEQHLAVFVDIWKLVWRDSMTTVDSVLLEQVARGYASIGQIGLMIETLGRMVSQNMAFQWGTLLSCLREAAAQGKWQDARRIVKIARIRNGGKPFKTDRERDMAAEFWRLAASEGVTDDGWETTS